MRKTDIDLVMDDLKNLVTKKREEAIDTLVAKLAEATPIDTGEASKGWQRKGNSIVNDVDHIVELNDGSSQQAPRYFIEQTVLNTPGVAPSGNIVTRQ